MSKSKINLVDSLGSNKINIVDKIDQIDTNPDHHYDYVKNAIVELAKLNLINQENFTVDYTSLAELLNITVEKTIDLLMKVKPQKISTLRFGAEEDSLKRIIKHFLGEEKKQKFIDSYNPTHTTNKFVFHIKPDQLENFNNISLRFVYSLSNLYKDNKRRNGQFYRRKSVLDFFTRMRNGVGGKRSRRFNTKKRRTRQRK